MRKMKKLLAVLLALSLVLSVLPLGVIAADAPESQAALPAEGTYKLNIVNDSPDQSAVYTVKIGDIQADLTLAPGETKVLGLEEGDSYSVAAKAAASPYYKLSSCEATFACGALNRTFDASWKHTLGAGFPTGQKVVNYYIGSDAARTEVSAAQVATLKKNTYYLAGSLWQWDVTKTYKALKGYAITFAGKNGAPDFSGGTVASFGSVKGVYSTFRTNALAAYTAANDTTYGYEIADDLAGTTGVGADGSYSIYCPVAREETEIVEPCPAADVTLTFCPVMEEKTGAVSANTFNMEKIEYAEQFVGLDTIGKLMDEDNRNVISALFTKGINLDTIGDVLDSSLANELVELLVMDDLPVSTVTLTEIDEGNGFYEGRTYTVPMKESILLDLDASSFGSIKLPVILGYNYYLSGVRAGKYLLRVSAPQADGYTTEDSTLEIEVKDGKTTSEIGEKQKHIGFHFILDFYAVNDYGIWFDRKANELSFTKVTMGAEALPGATFVIFNRDELLKLTNNMLSLGADVLNSVKDGLSYAMTQAINAQIRSGTESFSADDNTVEQLLTSYAALLSEGYLSRLQAPAILEATSDENGIVHFSEDNNVTVHLLLNLIPDIAAKLQKLHLLPNEINMGVLGTFNVETLRSTLMLADNNIGYYLLKSVGIVGDRFPTGNYVLFEKSAPEGYLRNPAMYTIDIDWDGTEYSAYARLGVVGPLFASQYYAFAEYAADGCYAINAKLAEYAAYADKGVAWMRTLVTGEDEVTASVIAYAANVVYYSMGGRRIYESPEAVADVLLSMLRNEDYTFTNLLNAVNELIGQSKNVVAGTVNTDWYYYNISEDLFSNAAELFDYVARKLVPGELVDAGEAIVEQQALALDALFDGCTPAEAVAP